MKSLDVDTWPWRLYSNETTRSEWTQTRIRKFLLEFFESCAGVHGVVASSLIDVLAFREWCFLQYRCKFHEAESDRVRLALCEKKMFPLVDQIQSSLKVLGCLSEANLRGALHPIREVSDTRIEELLLEAEKVHKETKEFFEAEEIRCSNGHVDDDDDEFETVAEIHKRLVDEEHKAINSKRLSKVA